MGKIGVATSLETELWGILKGLMLARERQNSSHRMGEGSHLLVFTFWLTWEGRYLLIEYPSLMPKLEDLTMNDLLILRKVVPVKGPIFVPLQVEL